MSIKKRPCIFHVNRLIKDEFKRKMTAEPKYEEIQMTGLFHQWGEEAEELGVNGFGNFTIGIVEDDEGQVYTVNPNNIKFLN